MRVLVDGLDTMIEGEVIGGKLLDGVSGQYDLEAAFTVQCDDGSTVPSPHSHFGLWRQRATNVGSLR